jgi:transposase
MSWRWQAQPKHYVLCEAMDTILEFVRHHPKATFMEIEKVLKDRNYVAYNYIGPHQHDAEAVDVVSRTKKNLIFWETKNVYVADAVGYLVHQFKLTYELADESAYPNDPEIVPNLPTAKEEKDYEKPHWMPVVFSIDEKSN